MARRLAPDLPRRSRVRLQVEHGLDARHARLLPERPDLPPLPPPRADVQPDVRVQRELHPAAVPRRGRARQGLAVLARCPATAGRSSPTCARCTPTCGRTPARSCCSWAASSPRSSEWSHERSLDWHLLERPEHAGIQALVRDLNRVYRDEPALWEVDSDPSGFWWLEPNDADSNVARVRPRRPRAASACWCSSPTCRPSPRPATGSGCRAPCTGARRSTPTRPTTAAATSATSAASHPEPVPWHDQPVSAKVTLPPLGAVWLVPEQE